MKGKFDVYLLRLFGKMLIFANETRSTFCKSTVNHFHIFYLLFEKNNKTNAKFPFSKLKNHVNHVKNISTQGKKVYSKITFITRTF